MLRQVVYKVDASCFARSMLWAGRLRSPRLRPSCPSFLVATERSTLPKNSLVFFHRRCTPEGLAGRPLPTTLREKLASKRQKLGSNQAQYFRTRCYAIMFFLSEDDWALVRRFYCFVRFRINSLFTQFSILGQGQN